MAVETPVCRRGAQRAHRSQSRLFVMACARARAAHGSGVRVIVGTWLGFIAHATGRAAAGDKMPASHSPAHSRAAEFFVFPSTLAVPAMPLFWKPYKSDATQLIESLKARDPKLEDKQRAGRALLWDKKLDRQAQSEWRDAKVAQQAYVYQTKHD